MGVRASRLVTINILKDLCGGGGEVPLTENDCFDENGEIDDEKFDKYLMQESDDEERKKKALLALAVMVQQTMKKRKRDELESERRRNIPRKKTRIARPRWFIDPITRVRRKKTPKMSAWWEDYIQDPQPNNQHWAKEFRQNFRLPYASFVFILDLIVSSDQSEGLFDRWKTHDDNCYTERQNKKVSPIELLLLGLLRYLGRGWTPFDDMRHVTYITRDVHQKFFHQFVKFGATVLYPLYVSAPQTVEALRDCEKEYNIAGFPGCIGSNDATNIPLEKVCVLLRQAHLGFKSKSTMRTYNLTCNHRCQILHTTAGHPGRWNDKTLIRFDTFMSELRDGALNDKMDFELRTRQGMADGGEDEGEERTLKLEGAYVIVDNGYLEWSTTVPPMKTSCNRSELRFSQWLESMRKDVECTFGILKGRWRILKTGIRLHNTEVADNIWLPCCVLHNMLLDVDGLSKAWKNGARSHWEMESGEFWDEETPFAICRLIDPNGIDDFRLRHYDASQFGYQRPPVEDSDNEEHDDGDDNRNRGNWNDNRDTTAGRQCGRIQSATAVNKLNMFQFRLLLVENFNIRFHANDLHWPKRLGRASPRNVASCNDHDYGVKHNVYTSY
ncbi:Plant transposon protein [Fragilaria crotonensis]|nr:Plant transposon protein [Fragilaria crotonensis]